MVTPASWQTCGALGRWPRVKMAMCSRMVLHRGGCVRSQPVTPCGGRRHWEPRAGPGQGPRPPSLPAAPDVTSGPSRTSAVALVPPSWVTRRPLPAGLPADCRGRWESFVEETLTETNRRNAVDLVRAWQASCGWESGAQSPGAPRSCPARQEPVRPGPGGWGSCPPTAVSGKHPPPPPLK